MAEFLLVIGLLLLTAFVFVVWLIVRITTWIIGGLFGLGRRPEPRAVAAASPPPPGWMNCRHPGCREANPPHARFCRRCGSQVAGVGDVTRMRYVA